MSGRKHDPVVRRRDRLGCAGYQRPRGRFRRDRNRLPSSGRCQADTNAGRAAGRERRSGGRPSRDRGQQHHRKVPQSALHPGRASAEGRRRRSQGGGRARRSQDRLHHCRANVIHAAPTRSMLADGLAQYLVWKQWKRWMLVVGSHEEDKLFAEALRRAASRFGAKIVQERVFEDTGGARRTDSGVTLIQRQMPVFTQQAPAYDVLVAADESEVFASYLPYRTWDPRPVAGSAGLIPKSWDPAQDQWGAAQMQNRFLKLNSRHMTALDMQAWTAARMIGEAVTRKNSGDPKSVLDFLKGPDFSIAAFKGQRLTLRDWNLQLRQPILLADGRMIVSVSPQEGFLHQVSELDTLGLDRPETKCKLH